MVDHNKAWLRNADDESLRRYALRHTDETDELRSYIRELEDENWKLRTEVELMKLRQERTRVIKDNTVFRGIDPDAGT